MTDSHSWIYDHQYYSRNFRVVTLKDCNEDRYPGTEILVKQLIVQGVAKHVVKALGTAL